MTDFIPLLSGLLVLFGVVITQRETRRRDRESRLWQRQADVYVQLIRWRLSPPDEIRIPNPQHYAEAEEEWTESVVPLLAEASLFGGEGIRRSLAEEPKFWRAARDLSRLEPRVLAELVRQDLGHTR